MNMKNEMELLNRSKLKTYLLLFDLKTGEQFSPNFLCNELLDVDTSLSDLNYTFKLDKKGDNPRKIDFVSYLKKNYILNNCFKLN